MQQQQSQRPLSQKTLSININRPSVKYTVDINQGTLYSLPNIIKSQFNTSKVLPKIFLVTHLSLNSLYGLKLLKEFEKEGFSIETDCINTGETSKSWLMTERLLNKMINFNMDRNSIVIALGGGVVGDMAGFASSIYQRGIRFIQVPTSLLAMVDASLGGKVAVNLGLVGKNLIGSFHQPSYVLIDLSLLQSLPEVEWKNGLAEVIKCAFLRDDNGMFYKWLSENKLSILRRTDYTVISHMVYEAARTKASIVMRDETETTGIRALLNLGHTFGHSLEASSRYRLAHGEAISIGITLAARLSLKLKKISTTVYDQIIGLVKDFKLTDHIDKNYGFTHLELIRHFKYDKKAETGQIKFVLPSGLLGHCEVMHNIDDELLKEVFSEATY